MKLEHEGLLVPGFELEGMNNFFSYDDVRGNVPTLNEHPLRGVD